MSHRYETNAIPEGENSVIEKCLKCNNKRIRYKSGGVCFFRTDGKISRTANPCNGSMGVKQAFSETTTKGPTEFVAKIIPPVATMIEKPLPDRTFKPLTDVEARLKETIVIIKLMYEDMIQNNLMTKSRQIAGRFLYSHGYEELIKQLNR